MKTIRLPINPRTYFHPRKVKGTLFEGMSLVSVLGQSQYVFEFKPVDGNSSFYFRLGAIRKETSTSVFPELLLTGVSSDFTLGWFHEDSSFPLGEVLLAIVRCRDTSLVLYFGDEDATSGKVLNISPVLELPGGYTAKVRFEAGEWEISRIVGAAVPLVSPIPSSRLELDIPVSADWDRHTSEVDAARNAKGTP